MDALAIGLQHDLDQRLFGAGRFLGDLTEAGVLRERHIAGLGRQFAGDDLEQRRLARAVAADEADLAAGRQRQAGIVDEKAPGDARGKIGDLKHGAAFATP